MKNSLKLAVFAIAATAAFSAAAATTGSAPATKQTVYMSIANYTGGCARVYANNGQRDLKAGESTLVGVAPNHNYMASVFKGRCGGAAVKNVWFRTPGTGRTSWPIR